MKLYLWNEPYGVKYGCSMVFAIAETEEQARELALSAPGYVYGDGKDNPPRSVALGAPTRVSTLPCAEWHKWEE